MESRYDPNSPCPKCGDIGADSEYQCAISLMDGTVAPERILRRCLRCGFGWSELPLDAKESE